MTSIINEILCQYKENIMLAATPINNIIDLKLKLYAAVYKDKYFFYKRPNLLFQIY